MLRSLIALSALTLSLLPALAQEKAVGGPTVTWHGQSFFTIKSSKGNILAIDPHLIPAFGRPEPEKADIVVLSHLHTDHTNLLALENSKDRKIISGLSGMGNRTNWNAIDETVKDFRVRSVAAYHDAAEGMTRGKNTIFIIEVDGWRLCHLGDLGHELSEAQIKKIGAVDAVMVPVGGIYTLNGSEAKKVVSQIQPKEYVFPMHYGLPFFDEILPIDEFLEDQEKAKVAVSLDNKIVLNRDKDRPRPLIVQLNYAPKKK